MAINPGVNTSKLIAYVIADHPIGVNSTKLTAYAVLLPPATVLVPRSSLLLTGRTPFITPYSPAVIVPITSGHLLLTGRTPVITGFGTLPSQPPAPSTSITTSEAPMDIRKLRLQDSGELIEGLQRSIDPRTSFPNVAKVLKDHRDNDNSLLRAILQHDTQLTTLSGRVDTIASGGGGSAGNGIIAYAA